MIFKNAFFATMIFATLTLPIGEQQQIQQVMDQKKYKKECKRLYKS